MAHTLTFHSFAEKTPEHGQQVLFFEYPPRPIPVFDFAEVLYYWCKKGDFPVLFNPDDQNPPGDGYTLTPFVHIYEDEDEFDGADGDEDEDQFEDDDGNAIAVFPARHLDSWCLATSFLDMVTTTTERDVASVIR